MPKVTDKGADITNEDRAREIANVTDVECGEYKHLVIAITQVLNEAEQRGYDKKHDDILKENINFTNRETLKAYRKGYEDGHLQGLKDQDKKQGKQMYRKGLLRGAEIAEKFGNGDYKSLGEALCKEADNA